MIHQKYKSGEKATEEKLDREMEQVLCLPWGIEKLLDWIKYRWGQGGEKVVKALLDTGEAARDCVVMRCDLPITDFEDIDQQAGDYWDREMA